MLRLRLRFWGRLTLALVFLALGCRSGTSPLTPVRGTVAYRGMPLGKGTIVFTPDPSRGTRGPLSFAEIQPDGSYALRSGESAGAVAGWHRVTVAAVVPPLPVFQGQRFAVPQSLLPEKYRDPDLCGLSREVKAGEANTINFDLD